MRSVSTMEGRGRDGTVVVCLVIFITKMWSNVAVAQAAVYRVIAHKPLLPAMVRSGD